ncbi:MAG: hypothetical protein E6Q97_21590 [Desulfurellales bacterium]|nr:MAG: hypothetical protein E6Q97_21590 [Desulfurellales bacterium]
MGFYWKIELTKNEIAVLKSCEAYTNRINNLSLAEKNDYYKPPKGRGTHYPTLWDEALGEVRNNISNFIRTSKALHEDGLLEQDEDIWQITNRGRIVLELIQGDINKINKD